MTKIITIQKTIAADAVQINSDEEDAQVRAWFTEMFQQSIDGITQEEAEDLARSQDLTPIVEARAWFARDNGNTLVYLIPPEDFVTQYVVIGEREIENVTDAFKIA